MEILIVEAWYENDQLLCSLYTLLFVCRILFTYLFDYLFDFF